MAPGKRAAISNMFNGKGYQVRNMTAIEYRCWLNNMGIRMPRASREEIEGFEAEALEIDALTELQNNNPNIMDDDDEDQPEFNQTIPGPVLKTISGIYFNLITKKLTDDNLTKWFSSRINAFKNANLADPDDPLFESLMPTIKFSKGVNSGMSVCFDFKKLVFKTVRGISQNNHHPLCETAKVTMIYYRFAELTAFAMVVEYILTKNPVLLAWNGIAKELSYLKSAVDKYRYLGPDAAYCKLLYPPEQLPEFHASKLATWTCIAYDIASYEGQKSLKNYRGADDTNLTIAYSRKCREIINYFSGAITRPVAHNRCEIFHQLNVQDELAI